MRPLKVIIDHYLWTRVGGGERVNAELVKGLMNAGHVPIVVTPIGFDFRKYKEWFGVDLPPESIYTLLPRFYPILGLYQRPLSWFSLVQALAKEKPDCIWVDNDFTRFVEHISSSKIVQYVHFPTPDYRLERDYELKYKSNLFWNLYFEGFLFLSRVFGDVEHKNANVICCNSKFIAEKCKRLWNKEPVVLYPPVDVEGFSNARAEGRERWIVMVGRISREKRYEEAIRALSKMKEDCKLHIVGGLIPTKREYLNYLIQLISSLHLQKRIVFHLNAAIEELKETFSRSKIFWHCTHGEHFGIAIVEGMASGVPAIVHHSGGQLMDITEYGKYGLSYKTIDELAEKTDQLLSNENQWKYYHEKSLERAWKFNKTEFMKQAIGIIENLCY